MGSSKKLIQAAAGSAGGAGLDIDEVFSTYLYEGNGSTQTITNGIDLSGEGGLVWIKVRTSAQGHSLTDTERGNTKNLRSDTTSAESTNTDRITSFNSNGFSLSSGGYVNGTNDDYASWTFRKAPKFFDIVTYTGTGSNLSVAHTLDHAPGFVAVKRTDAVGNWRCWHVGLNGGTNQYTKNIVLNDTSGEESVSYFYQNPDASNLYLAAQNEVNDSSGTYVAYLFAHNNGDGEFGSEADQDIIKCGSFTLGANYEAEIDLGWEPQWLLTKKVNDTGGWYLHDSTRGMTYNKDSSWLYADTSDSETTNTTGGRLRSTGFNSNGQGVPNDQFIYIAIRRGPLAAPESATEVFDVETSTSATPRTWNSGFPVDLSIYCHRDTFATNKFVGTRLTGNSAYLVINGTSAESSSSNLVEFDHSDKIIENNLGSTNSKVNWMWKRAPGYFDVVAYTGNGTSGNTISHNLGVVPEMMWVKQRDVSRNWTCYFETLGTGVVIKLNDSTLAQSKTQRFDTAPTDSVFYLGNDSDVNSSGGDYIAYLFATVAGVSKVGSFTHTINVDTNVDCGFSSGARFIIIKRTDSTGDWYVFDTVRGIVSGNDAGLFLNNTTAEQSANWIEPLSSGFQVRGAAWSTGDYIFYAIAT